MCIFPSENTFLTLATENAPHLSRRTLKYARFWPGGTYFEKLFKKSDEKNRRIGTVFVDFHLPRKKRLIL